MTLTLTTVLVATDRGLPQELASTFSKAVMAIKDAQSSQSLDTSRVSLKDEYDRMSADGAALKQGSAQETSSAVDPAIVGHPDMPPAFEKTAVFLTTDSNGETSGATIVTISKDRMGGETKISIQQQGQSQTDTVVPAMITCGCVSADQDTNIVYGHVLKDANTLNPTSLFLITPSQASGLDQDLYLFTSVTTVETVDPACAFSNYGFTTFSGRETYQSFGGAVSIDVNGRKFIVWLDMNQQVSSGFSGDMAARSGILDATPGSSSLIAAGRNVDLRLVFSSGTISEIWQGTSRIENFDNYVRDVIEDSTEVLPIEQHVVNKQNNFITRQASYFVDKVYERNYALTTAINHSTFDDRRNRNDLANKRIQDILNSRV